MEKNIDSFNENIDGKEKKTKSPRANNNYWIIGLILTAFFCVITFVALCVFRNLDITDGIRILTVRITLLLLTFSVGLHAHELRALRSEKTRLDESFFNLKFKKIELNSIPKKNSALQKDMKSNWDNARNKLEENMANNESVRNILFPLACLCIINYFFALFFSCASSVGLGVESLDFLAIGFLLSGSATFIFGLTVVIIKD